MRHETPGLVESTNSCWATFTNIKSPPLGNIYIWNIIYSINSNPLIYLWGFTNDRLLKERSGWTNPFEKLRKSNWSEWTSNFRGEHFPKIFELSPPVVNDKFISGTSVGHFELICRLCVGSCFLVDFCWSANSHWFNCFWDIHWRKTSKLFKHPDSCTMRFSNRFHHGKKNNMPSPRTWRNRRSPTETLVRFFQHQKFWRCDHCWPRCNTKFNSNLRIKGWSSYWKLRLCLKRFTTSLQTTPTKVLNATWVKCTTIDGRGCCTDWFGWYLIFSMEFCVSRQLLQDPVRQFCQVAIEFNGHSVDWEENILTTKISWTIANSWYIVHPERMVKQLETKSVFSPVF